MRQPLFGLPPIESIPRSAHSAYRRLEAEIRRAGWEVTGPEAADRAGGLSLHLAATYPGPRGLAEIGAMTTSSGSFEIRKRGPGGIEIHHHKGLSVAFEEVRRQFVAITQAGVQEAFHEVRSVPRVPLRGVRVGPGFWNQPTLSYKLEDYLALGFNAVLVDLLDLPITGPRLQDEGRAAEWESKACRVLESLVRKGWWTMAILPTDLDLGSSQTPEGRFHEKPFCRLQPSSRRRLLHRFESLARRLPAVAAIGFSIADWGRCECRLCRQTSSEEEAAYYLRAYSAVMKRHCPAGELWFLPDPFYWERLLEIRSQIPAEANSVIPAAEDSRQLAKTLQWLPRVRHLDPVEREGEAIEVASPFEGGWLDPERFAAILSRWEQDRPPRLATVRIEPDEPQPVGLAAFVGLAWQRWMKEVESEEWVYRFVLPPEEWSTWAEWREKNETVRRAFSATRNRTDEPGVALRDSEEKRKVSAGSQVSALAELAQSCDCRTATSKMNLPFSLSMAARRWLGERALLPILDRVDRIPDGVALTHAVLSEVLDLHDDLDAFLRSDDIECFSSSEKRCLENLEIFLSLLVTEWRIRGTWKRNEVPDLWIRDFIYSRSMGKTPPGG